VRSYPAFLLVAALACGQPSASNGAPATPNAQAATTAAPAADGLPDPVAMVNGTPITRAELEEKAAPQLMAAMQALYEARSTALDQMIVERLLEAAAKAQNTDVEGLLKIEVEGKVTPVDDAAVSAFYNENRARMPPGPMEEIAPRIREHLTNEGKGKRMQEYVEGLKAAAGVQTFLEPYRVTVPNRANAPVKGSVDAPVRIVEFSDFQCPYCTRGAAVVEEVLAAYGDKVAFEFRHFPLSFHDRAHKSAQASECANDQGKFFAYHDLLFANQGALQDNNLADYATQAGLDVAAFNECYASGKHAATVDADMAAGSSVGMQGTPGFFINGRNLSGAQPLPAFKEIIDAELKAKGLL
jgi:protein-disulfide isomerase